MNPGLGCSGDDDYDFGETEMRAAVEGSWRVQASDWSSVIALMKAPEAKTAARGHGFVRPAAACGSRLFGSAAACVDISTLHLTGMVTEGTGAGSGKVTARFDVVGMHFTSGQLNV